MLAPAPAQPRSVRLQAHRKAMATQRTVGSPTQPTLNGAWKRNHIDRAKVEAILARSQPLADKPERLTLAERIERVEGAMTAEQLAKMLNVSKITIFKQAKAGRIPSFRIGTCVRFDPKTVAAWLRTM